MASRGGTSFVPSSASRAGSLASNSPDARSSVISTPSKAIPRSVFAVSRDTLTSASAMAGSALSNVMSRARYTTRSDRAKLCTGRLTLSPGPDCATTSWRKTAGKLNPRRFALASDDINMTPSRRKMLRCRVSKFCVAKLRKTSLTGCAAPSLALAPSLLSLLAVRIGEGLAIDSNFAVCANTRSTLRRPRLIDASALLRTWIVSRWRSASAAFLFCTMRIDDDAATATTRSAAIVVTARSARRYCGNARLHVIPRHQRWHRH